MRYKRIYKRRTEQVKKPVRRRRKLKASPGRRPVWARKLKRLEYRFISEYLVDLNKTQAYKRANPYPVTYGSACSGAIHLLKIPRVKIALEGALEEELGIPKSRIVDELSAIAFCNPKEFVQWNRQGHVTFTDSDDIDDSRVGAVSEISRTANGLRIKFADKLGGLQRLAAILGISKEVETDRGSNLTINVVRFGDADKVEVTPSSTQKQTVMPPLLEDNRDVAVPY